MKKLLSLLMCMLMITSIVNFSSIVNAVTSIELPEFSTEETAETAEADENTSKATFETQSDTSGEFVSDYEIKEKDELVDKTITGYYNGYTVEVTGKLPVVATLSLTSVDGSSAQKLVAETDENGRAVFACDIKIIDENGKQWQPEEESVKVTVNGIEEDKEIKFLHISEDIRTVLSEENPSALVQTINGVEKKDNGEVSFETFGFSTFVGFTVDFHYNGNVYSIQGESDVLISEVFETLGVDKDVADVQSVTFSDETLVSVEEKDGDWILVSKKPFTTVEKLTVTFNNGATLELKVTDEFTYANTETVTIGTATSAVTACGGAVSFTPYVSGSTNYFDTNPDTIDTYLFQGTIPSGWHLTVNLVGNIQLWGNASKEGTTDVSYLIVGTGAKLTVKNNRNKHSVFMAGDITQNGVNEDKRNMIDVMDGAALELLGYSNDAHLILDGRDVGDAALINYDTAAASDFTLRTSGSRMIYFTGTDNTVNTTEDSFRMQYVTVQNHLTRKGTSSVTNVNTYKEGSGILVSGRVTTVDIQDCKFDNLLAQGYTYQGGSALTFSNTFDSDSVYIKNTVFNNCRADNYNGQRTNNGGVILFADGSSVDSVVITGESSENRSTQFINCKNVDSRGGAISFGHDTGLTTFGTVDINYCKFDTCTAGGVGGSLAFEGGFRYSTHLKMKGNEFISNSGSYGGAVCMMMNSATHTFPLLEFKDNIFSGCKSTGTTADIGGGAIRICTNANNDLTYTDVRFDNNEFNKCSSAACGGSVLLDVGLNFGELSICDNKFTGLGTSTACATFGGAVYYNGKTSGSVKILRNQFKDLYCSDNSGGAVYMRDTVGTAGSTDVVLQVKNNTFTNCRSNKYAGAFATYANFNGSVEILNNSFDNCYTQYQGGAINCGSTVTGDTTVSNCTFNNCRTTATADATPGNGGAIHFSDDYIPQGSTYIKNNTFTSCTGKADGGAIFCGGTFQKLCIGNDVDDPSDDNEKVSNKFYNCVSNSGGAIRIDGKSVDLSINRNYIEDCTATGNWGGGISIGGSGHTTSEFRVNENRIINGTAKRGGGGFLTNALIGTSSVKATVAEMKNNAFKNCKATSAATDTATSRGGAVLFYNSSVIYADEILFQYDDDFGIYTSQDKYMNPEQVDENGDPLPVTYEAAFDKCTTSTTWNSADYGTSNSMFENYVPYGGGICFSCDASNMNQFMFHIKPGLFDSLHVFKECDSFVSGALGFPHASSKPMFKNIIVDYGPEKGVLDDGAEYDGNAHDEILRNRTGATFKDCFARRNGAIIGHYNTSVDYIVMDGIIADGSIANEGAAISIGSVKISDYIIKDSIIENSCSPKLLKINSFGGTIKTAGATACKMTVDNTTFRGNKSHWSGGGFYWNAGGFDTLPETSATIKNCMFDDNHAVYAGGGIYNESIMSVYNTVVKNNTSATVGGGIKTTIYANNATIWNASKIDLTIGAGCEIYGNKAGLFGGGIGVHLRYSQNVLYNMSNKRYSKFTMSFTMNDVFTAEDVREGYNVGDPIPENLQPKVMDNVAGLHGGGIYYGLGFGSYKKGWDSYIDTTTSAKWSKTTSMSDCANASASLSQKVLNATVKNINIKSGVISGNKAGYDGGGIYANVDRTVINVSNGKIYGNSAGVSNDVITLINDVKGNYTNGYEPASTDTANFRDETLSVMNEDGTYFQTKQIRLDESIEGFGGGIAVKGTNSVCNITGGFIGQSNDDSDGSDAQNHKYANRADFGGAIGVKEGTINITSPYVLDGATSFNLSSLYAAYGITYDYSKIPANVTNEDGESLGLPVVSANEKYIATRDTTNSDWVLTLNPDYNGVSNEEPISVELTDGSIQYFTVADKATETGDISYNYSKGGAGIYTMGSGTINIANGNIHNNHVEASGALNKDTSNVDTTITNIDTYSGSKISEIEGERTVAVVDAITPGSGGGIFANAGTVTLSGGNVYNNTATNGAGGGVYALSGGSVIMNSGMLYDNRAEATTTSGTTAYQGATYAGVGGAIALGSGASSTKVTKFTLNDIGAKLAIYNNIADFAADDVYASGSYTQLDIPNTTDMDIPNKNNVKQSVGWFEDFHPGDEEFDNAISNSSLASTDTDRVGRYRLLTDEYRTQVPNVDVATISGRKATTDVGAYVCMTLGIVEAGGLKIGKTVVSTSNENINSYYDEWYQFTITLGAKYNDSDTEIPEYKGVYQMTDGAIEGNGIRVDDKYCNITSIPSSTGQGKTYVFKIKNGYYARFEALGNYTVTEDVTDAQKNYVIDTTYRLKKYSNGSFSAPVSGTVTSSILVNETSPYEVDFINKLISIEFSIKYYDRKMEQGKPSDMNSEASTTKTYVVGKDIFENFSSAYTLADYAVHKVNRLLPDNMLDKYSVYAESVVYHNDHYGKPTSEKWLQWYNGDTAIDLTSETLKTVTNGTIWLKNSLKGYTVNYYNLTANPIANQLVKYTYGGKTYYACNNKGGTINAFYNQRIGAKNTEDESTNAYTDHLNAYNKPGYTGTDVTSKETVTFDGKTLYFSHWSFDPQGTIIATTDYNFAHRVTKSFNVYAIYTDEVSKERGLSVDANTPDTFMANGVEKTRLNTMVSIYNFGDGEGNEIINNLAGIYVIPDSTTNIDSNHISAVQKWILAELNRKDYSSKSINKYTLQITQSDINADAALKGLKGANFIVYTDTENNPIVFSNKNRVNMTVEFKNETLKNRRMLAFAAINYTYNEAGDTFWRISDNCIDYTFDENGNNTGMESIFESVIE